MNDKTKPISSMTAYARVAKSDVLGEFIWEIRSVNHRYFDAEIKLPSFLIPLESLLRELLRKQVQRGSISCYLKYIRGGETGTKISVNQAIVAEYVTALDAIANACRTSDSNVNKNIITQIDLGRILTFPDVLMKSEHDAALLKDTVLTLFSASLQELCEVREREGAQLVKAITEILGKISAEVAKVKERRTEIIQKQREKLLNKFQEIKGELEPMRLEQEMVLYAQKVDVSEEIERLEIHLQEFQRILQAGGTVGKRLDFLIQELNREANTLASKAADLAATYAAVEIKVLLEQIREQIQNLE